MGDNYYIGLMSGTSFDGIDAVLVNFANNTLNIIENHSLPYPDDLKTALFNISRPNELYSLEDLYRLDAKLGALYARTVLALIAKTEIKSQHICAIGSHGQTIRHFPNEKPGFTVQIGDPNIIAAETGITTVADFRRADIARGGQGAPLGPAFHDFLFRDQHENRAVLNIGGFANITLLPASGAVTGFDTGPGNSLLDAWAMLHLHQPYDAQGAWANSGKIHADLLAALLSHPYFAKQPPKSTGRDEFNLSWLSNVLSHFNPIPPEDVQATLTELTAVSITQEIVAEELQALYICGGGANNTYLVSRIAHHLPSVLVTSTEALGLHPQHTEAALMAWLAYCTMNKRPIHLEGITGSKTPAILGGVYFA